MFCQCSTRTFQNGQCCSPAMARHADRGSDHPGTQGRPLAEVVDAVAHVADTLARLQEEFGNAHRDIKPGNLYERDGSWLIGDFGLVSIPDAEALTAQGHQLGPAHYTAYEMIIDPSSADPHPADVYSLGKTLWVLATGRARPPEGHQAVNSRGFGIGDFRPDPRVRALDQEVDLMTRMHPGDRPSKEQVARDLLEWKDLASAPIVLDVADARVKLNAKLAAKIAEEDIQEQRKELAYAAIRRLQELTAPLNAALRELYPRAEVDTQSDEMTRNLLATRQHLGDTRTVVLRWQRCTILSPFDRAMSCVLRMSRSLELFDEGTLRLMLMVNVRPERTMHSYYDSSIPTRDAPVGSIAAERALDDGFETWFRRWRRRSRSSCSTSPRPADRRSRTWSSCQPAADQAVDRFVPSFNDLQRLGGVTVEVDTCHVVDFRERIKHIGGVVPRFDPQEATRPPPDAPEILCQLAHLRGDDTRRD